MGLGCLKVPQASFKVPLNHMQKFIIEGRTAKATVAYFPNGSLQSLTLAEPYDPEILEWFMQFCPVSADRLRERMPGIKGKLLIKEIPTDLSFNRFWEEYGYKVGRKEKVMALWAGLDEITRIKIFEVIPRYRQWLANKRNMEQSYAETWLRNKRWEDKYIIS